MDRKTLPDDERAAIRRWKAGMELVNREEEAELERLSPEESRRALNDLFEFARHFPDPQREREVAVVRARWVRAKQVLGKR